jgi:serine phosphatase RsbU (regulator of sigma subunit)/HAMP domain-containing protein
MNFRLTIGRKIGTGFGILLILTFIVFLLTSQTLDNSREINNKINKTYNPSIAALESLKGEILRTRMLITNWAFVQSREDTKEKQALKEITNHDLPNILRLIDTLSINWSTEDRMQKQVVYNLLSELLVMYETVKATLPDMKSYDVDINVFTIRDYAEEGGQIDIKANLLIDELNKLITQQQMKTTLVSKKMIQAFLRLDNYIRNFGLALIFLGILIAILTARSITKPVKELKNALTTLGVGSFPKSRLRQTNDEVGEMAYATNNLIEGLKRTANFSYEVGKGNFDSPFEPLGEEDVLGHALIKMSKELKHNEMILEKKVFERTKQIEEQNKELVRQTEKIEKQNKRVVELYKDVTDSIRYAKRLQESILPSEKLIRSIFPNSFVFYKPKDIVSGDLFFFKKIGKKTVFAAIDCTGHGVPGAFMSLVSYNSLNLAIRDTQDLNAAMILNDLNKIATSAINNQQEDAAMRDSMDISLCVFDHSNLELQYAGAYNPICIIRNNELHIIKGDKISIGSENKKDKNYENHVMQMIKDDFIYLFSDGYIDQFGGQKGKKLMLNAFKSLLLEAYTIKPEEQTDFFNSNLFKWRDGREQVDDILVLGIKI